MQQLKFILFTFIILLSFGVKSQDISSKYKKSLDTWKKQRNSHENSYIYIDKYTGMLGVTETEVVVEFGEVIRQTIKFYGRGDKVVSKTIKQGKEAKKSAKTIDEIYEFAKKQVLTKKDDKTEYKLYFTLKDDFLLKKVGYYPIGCKDDCFKGYNIKEIRWLN